MKKYIIKKLLKIAESRNPDIIIGHDDPYLLRWWLIPKNRFFGVYLHCFKKSDDDRALHDHPWSNLSMILKGSYTEHTISQGGIHVQNERFAGDWKIRIFGTFAHRIELSSEECWTLFITGPKYREWGFHCPFKGWVHWKDFGRFGCEENIQERVIKSLKTCDGSIPSATTEELNILTQELIRKSEETQKIFDSVTK